jgi:hypothetical protein
MIDPDMGNSALRLWVAAGSAALLVFVCALAFDWTRTRTVARISVVVVGAVLGATLAWAFLEGANVRDLSAERRALELRAAELNAQALAPGSPLACLDAMAGDTVEAACEKTLFAAPATVAAATSYVAARLALLADVVAYTRRSGATIDNVLLPLRRALETDRFGFVAHTLSVRDGCSSESCKALTLLHDGSRVRANLSGQTLDRYLDHYAAVWAEAPATPVADAAPAGAPGQPPAAGPHKMLVGVDFPDASSIPPISIMNPEPKGAMTPAAAAAAVTAGSDTSAAAAAKEANKEAKEAAPAKKPVRKQTASAPAPAPPQAAAPVDPVWSPGATLASPQPPPSGGPMQLNPHPAPPEASAGGSARAQ